MISRPSITPGVLRVFYADMNGADNTLLSMLGITKRFPGVVA